MRASRRPRLGQNFLSSPRTAGRIVDALGAPAGSWVVEVGPGKGALTRPLLARGLNVLAVEVDARLAARLHEELGGEALRVVEADALAFDAAGALAEAGAVPPVPLVANLPYESATPMVRAFARRRDLFARLVVMVQREVADRICSRPGDDGYGFLSVDVGLHAAARRLFDVPPGDFSPRPKVVSTVIELVPAAPPEDASVAIAVASAGFGVRRKTLVNGLGPVWGREAASEAVASAGLLPTVRAEEVPPEGFLALARRLGPRPAAAGTR
ncbi:MAG TPA: 16S rRNA (adenine(1518)-N(6)/adenine(1519)-N(6))-dimethyltransferase RsmA [Thermoanaerobaculia bacterium]|nr:16S rRNA (adenine(1518)-N(6)/adenine(1519)-N(6))-dimethyltransferase RsmA [Thermoanaerobaculia bacterium]HQP87311.1 16S rRNA (adenine(1518)-N(6)/adenine(1519)-N(6))-dimethyltransferase RsmA [Thermoanaerobaculia bacterium]